MTASLVASLVSLSVFATAEQDPARILSIVNERVGTEAAYRFVLTGAPAAYSATPEGSDLVVRIGVESREGLLLPLVLPPVDSAEFIPGPTFGLKLRLRSGERVTPEMVRDTGSILLILRRSQPARDAREARPDPDPSPAALAPTPEPSPGVAPPADPARRDAQPSADDLYRILFPAQPGGVAPSPDVTAMGAPLEDDWFSDFRFLGLQVKPWVSASWVQGETRVGNQPPTRDTHYLVQPNLGIGFSPELGPGGGRWRLNYTPRFREQVDVELPELTSHFFDANVDQPLGARANLSFSYHHSRGVLDTQEVDPGREYGIGRQYVVDLELQPFRRNSFGGALRVDLSADLHWEINGTITRVRYAPGETNRAALPFFSYDSRSVGASVRRSIGSRTFSIGYTFSDTPPPEERPEAESRAHGVQAGIDGEITPLLTGRIAVGFRSQENPGAGAEGRSYRDLSYAAQLQRELSETSQFSVGAERRVNLSAYGDNAFYVADAARADLSFRLPFTVSARAGFAAQWNGYRVPETSLSGTPARRRDRITAWNVGLVRSVTRFAYLRADYFSERRDSNLDEFDVRSRAFVVQLAIGGFGKPDASRFAW